MNSTSPTKFVSLMKIQNRSIKNVKKEPVQRGNLISMLSSDHDTTHLHQYHNLRQIQLFSLTLSNRQFMNQGIKIYTNIMIIHKFHCVPPCHQAFPIYMDTTFIAQFHHLY